MTCHSADRGEEPRRRWGPYLRLFVTPSGWAQLKKSLLESFKTGFAIAKMQRANPGFGMNVFREDALALYGEVCAALAAGDHSTLRQVQRPIGRTLALPG